MQSQYMLESSIQAAKKGKIYNVPNYPSHIRDAAWFHLQKEWPLHRKIRNLDYEEYSTGSG